ncbi:MAG: hypothetical protein ACI39T_04715, partial [Candidatus Cryptobacteroides sp.]
MRQTESSFAKKESKEEESPSKIIWFLSREAKLSSGKALKAGWDISRNGVIRNRTVNNAFFIASLEVFLHLVGDLRDDRI